jgi:hypothetical protein
MYIEFSDEEKAFLMKEGFIEAPKGRYTHQDPNYQEFFIEVVKRPDGTVESSIIFDNEEVITTPFPSFDSFTNVSRIILEDK